jgi:hypothetical protein
MNPYILGISAFVIMLVVLVVSLIIGLTLVKLLDIAVNRGGRVVSAWRHRPSTSAQA